MRPVETVRGMQRTLPICPPVHKAFSLERCLHIHLTLGPRSHLILRAPTSPVPSDPLLPDYWGAMGN